MYRRAQPFGRCREARRELRRARGGRLRRREIAARELRTGAQHLALGVGARTLEIAQRLGRGIGTTLREREACLAPGRCGILCVPLRELGLVCARVPVVVLRDVEPYELLPEQRVVQPA